MARLDDPAPTYLPAGEWLSVVRRDYLTEFVRNGGSSVKFAIARDDATRTSLIETLGAIAAAEHYPFARIDAASTRIHLAEKLFQTIARQIPWDELTDSYLARLFRRNAYQLPASPADRTLREIAALNGRDERELLRDVKAWLERDLFRDESLSQEFRVAMLRLCLAQLDPYEVSPELAAAIKQWLRGELPRITVLKPALIYQQVARHNARDLLLSLIQWLRLAGRPGLVLTLDVARLRETARPREPDGTFYYSNAAVLDAYEVLRQFVDATDELAGCLVAVVAPIELLTDERRGLGAYDALRLRIWDEVRDRRRPNPLAALVRIAGDGAGPAAIDPDGAAPAAAEDRP
jgi:hypothetical protein